MSLARSLTSRMRARFEEHSSNSGATSGGGAGPVPSRAFSTKTAAARANDRNNNIDRRLISLPVELLSTSNAQAYEAPDIKNLIEPSQHMRSPLSPTFTLSQPAHSPLHIPLQPQSPAPDALFSPQLSNSSASSTHSWEDGLTSPTSPALTSASSVISHEVSREPSPLSCDPNPMSEPLYLDTRTDGTNDKDKTTSINVTEVLPESPVIAEEPTVVPTVELTKPSSPIADTAAAAPAPPAVPQRSATHTKEVHQNIARQRSLSRISTSPRRSAEAGSVEVAGPETKPRSPTRLQAPQISPLPSIGTDFFSSKTGEEHPFGAELAKVSELAEEFGASAVQIVDEETQFLVDNGFRCFGATDYILEIQPLFSRAFGEPALPVISEWI